MAIADVLFLPWPTWAKLSFILGGLMAIILVVATVVKAVHWRQNIKLEHLASEEKAERGEMILPVRASDEMPFGLKAMEEDPEVEGVWNSHTTTPLHTPPGSIKGSSPLFPVPKPKQSKKTSISSSLYKVDLTSPVLTTDPALPSSAPATTRAIIDPATAQSAPTRKKKDTSITISYTGPSQKSYPAHSAVSGGTKWIGDSTDDGPLTPRTKFHLRSSPPRTKLNHRKFIIGGRSSPLSPRKQAEFEGQQIAKNLDAHRRLHSAESGQLVRKTGRRSLTEDRCLSSSRSESDTGDTTTRALSWPTRNGDLRLSQKLPRKAVKIISPEAVPFRAFVEQQPPPKPCPSAWNHRTDELMIEALSQRSVSHSNTLSSLVTDTSLSTLSLPPKPLMDILRIANTQSRRINEGFEILPAGTFFKESEVKDLRFWPSPLMSTENISTRPTKLQKGFRSGSVSRRYSIGSQESRNSRDRNTTY